MQIIGITGTDGKTSTSMFTAQLLEQIARISDTPFGKEVTNDSHHKGKIGLLCSQELRDGKNKRKNTTKRTTPSAGFLWNFLKCCYINGCTHVVIEVSSHAISQRRIRGIDFDIVAVTNLSQEHGDYYPTMEAYAQTKAKIFTTQRKAIVNADMPLALRQYFDRSPSIEYFSHHNREVTMIEVVSTQADQVIYRLHHKGTTYTIPIPFAGAYNADNITIVCLILQTYGIKITSLIPLIQTLQPVSGRMQEVTSGVLKNKQIRVFIDFAVTPQAIEQVLRSFGSNKKKPDAGHIWLVFGCTGGNHDHTKRPLMGQVAVQYADHIVFTEDESYGECFDTIVSETFGEKIPPKVTIIPERKDAIEYALSHTKQRDIVIITGMGDLESRNNGEKEIDWSDIEMVKRWTIPSS